MPSSNGNPACLITGQRRSARAAVVAGDQDVIGVAFDDPRGDRANPHFGDQLDADAGGGVGVLQIVDQLLEILDGIDIVVRRRAYEADARRRVAGLGNGFVDFATGQLTALARLSALRDFDL